jgi:hypothetical protein
MMLIEIVFLVGVQTAAVPIDPITRRMHAICRSQQTCVSRQREGMRQFLRMISMDPAVTSLSHVCLAKSAKGWLTNWTKAERCLRQKAGSDRRP